jgi:hypothetical protein
MGGMPRPDALTRARELRAKRYSLAAIAEILHDEGYPTSRGGTWLPSAVWSMLNTQSPFAASLAPCTECGHPTSSKYGICRSPACRNAYQRKRDESQKPDDLRKLCTSCGRPTTSALNICGRRSCHNEYARARTAASGSGSSVYAVWFPVPSVLKVGFSKHTVESRIACSVRGRARERSWDTGGSACIWQRPGDNRTEAWMQATLAFRWRHPFHAGDGRLCEWFTVYHLTVEEIIEVLNGTYRLVPPDLTRPVMAVEDGEAGAA